MLELPQAVLESLQFPQRLHAALVHLPIGAAVFGLVLVLALALSRGRSAGVRWVTVAVYLLGLGAAVLAERAGEAAVEVLVTSGVQRTAEARTLLDRHEEMGEAVWIFFLASALLTSATVIRWHPIRLTTMVLAIACGTAAAGWVGVTGFYGGELVYAHGLGVPTSANNLPLNRGPVGEVEPGKMEVAADASPASGVPATQPAIQP